ncbi:MAG: cation-translocating P-type ATPase [Candidatus Liptonbacteria bacterium]
MKYLNSPYREYVVIVAVFAGLIADLIVPSAAPALLVISLIGAVPTAWKALESLFKRRISIDTFNVFALAISFFVHEVRSAAFIVLMLSFADLLEWRTSSRAHSAVKALLQLKPEKAVRMRGEAEEEIPAAEIRENDVLLVKEGERVPADGTVIFGSALMNESSVTGESLPVTKTVGDRVISGTVSESGIVKFRATHVGENSTLEQMAGLIREAQKNKSRSERMADHFAAIFLPIIILGGVAVYFITHDIRMAAALFLVACADDMAVAIPLAITAAIGHAAKRGVIIKGGEWLSALGKIDTLVLDKTGTLTYGSFALREVEIEKGITEKKFWTMVGTVEKFSDHPVSRATFKEAQNRVGEVPDPDEVKIFKGSGIWVRSNKDDIAIGNEGIYGDLEMKMDAKVQEKLAAKRAAYGGTVSLVLINRKFAGIIVMADIPREEAAKSIREIKNVGVKETIMFTGDNEAAASIIASKLGITYAASMLPEDKMRRIEDMSKRGTVAMVGDGINDAPALSRANVGIAMGNGGSAIAVEAADVVILTDKLDRIPEMILLGRNTSSVIKWDMILWMISNIFGFALVLTGVAGPAFAAFYNFATDFLPLINSGRLFKMRTTGTQLLMPASR